MYRKDIKSRNVGEAAEEKEQDRIDKQSLETQKEKQKQSSKEKRKFDNVR